MAEHKNIPLRQDVDPKYTWSIEHIFPSDKAWEDAVWELESLCEHIRTYEGQVTKDAKTLLAYMTLETKIHSLLGEIFGYASRRYDVDTTNAAYQAMRSRAASARVNASGALSFADPEILALSDETLESYYQTEPELLAYKRSINELRRLKDHILTPAEEKILAAAGELAAAPDSIFTMMNNADAKFPPVVDDDGKTLPLSNGTYISLMQNSNRRIRKDAFTHMYATLKERENATAAVLSAQISQLKFYAKARKYSSTLEASLSRTNVPVSVYKNLIQTVHDAAPSMHKYMKLRKKLMGLDELHMYDIYAPIVSNVDVKIDYEQAKDIVFKSVAPLGKPYQSIMEEGLNGGWIDVYENAGKRAGAYSSGHTVHPFVLLNYQNNLKSVFTLAHEMGHAIHSYLSTKTQLPQDRRYVIFVAEVASTCNESLLMQYLLKNTTDTKVRAYLTNYLLEQFRNVIYRQTLFAEFEMRINEASEKGIAITADYLKHLYHELNVTYYGEDIVVDELFDLEWARIPHFYYNFYVFQYATGFSAAMALSKKILEEGAPAVEKYINFLSSGCTKDPISLLRDAGVDMNTPEPIADALKQFDVLIDELESMMS